MNPEQAMQAITEPVKRIRVTYSDAAVKKIVEITKGYPFFIQQLCQIVYQKATGSDISYEDVTGCIDEFFESLDNGFFKVR